MLDQIHQYSTILEALQNLKGQGEIDFVTFSDNWIVKFWRGDEAHFLYAQRFDVNSRVATDISTDKVATFLLLDDQHVPVVPHYLLTTPVQTADRSYLDTLFARHKELVIKPTHGSRGEDVVRCSDTSHALLVTRNTSIPSWSASPYIDVKTELRLVLLNGKAELAYEKQNPPVVHGLKMFNLHRGATASRMDITAIDQTLIDIAQRGMTAINLALGAVDIVLDQDGTPQVLEINSGFSLEHYAALSRENRQQVIGFYEQVIRAIFAR